MLDLESLTLADPARDLEPPRERTRARLDALLAVEPKPAPRHPRRRPARVAAGLAALAALAAVVAASMPGSASPAEAFANRLQGDGIVHMVLGHERTHDASGDGVNPRQDELWISLADGSWRLRIRLFGNTIDTSFDGRTVTVYDSRTGKTTTDTPTDPEQLKGRPFDGPSVAPLADPHLQIAGETTIDGETVYDLTPVKALPDGLHLHWYVTKDGKLRRMVQSADDVIDQASGKRGPASLTTDVDSYEVLANTPANQALLR
jgi:hypothetical protein